MIDATGMPQTAVLVGGTSEIGLAVVRRLAERRLESVLLAGRDPAALAARADGLRRAGVPEVSTATADVLDPASLEALPVHAAEALGTVDLAIVAAGDLGTAELAELDAGRVAQIFATNAGGPAAALLAFGKHMAAQGSGRLVVLSSVAGVRVRRANFVYGSAKAGLDAFAGALGDALQGSGVAMTIVRPGFVRTRMTEGMSEAPFAVGPDDVADAVVRGLETGSRVVWAPAVLRGVFTVLRALPAPVFKRLPG